MEDVTPETHRPNPLLLLIGSYIMMLLVLTPIVALAWNLGVQPSGIASEGIGWSESVGLSLAVLIGRLIMAGARPLPPVPVVLPLRQEDDKHD